LRCQAYGREIVGPRAPSSVIMDAVRIDDGALNLPFVTATSNLDIGRWFHKTFIHALNPIALMATMRNSLRVCVATAMLLLNIIPISAQIGTSAGRFDRCSFNGGNGYGSREKHALPRNSGRW